MSPPRALKKTLSWLLLFGVGHMGKVEIYYDTLDCETTLAKGPGRV